MAVDAASGWVLDELEDGKSAPVATPLADVKPDADGFVNMIAIDVDTYAEKYGSEAVQKSLN